MKKQFSANSLGKGELIYPWNIFDIYLVSMHVRHIFDVWLQQWLLFGLLGNQQDPQVSTCVRRELEEEKCYEILDLELTFQSSTSDTDADIFQQNFSKFFPQLHDCDIQNRHSLVRIQRNRAIVRCPGSEHNCGPSPS